MTRSHMVFGLAVAGVIGWLSAAGADEKKEEQKKVVGVRLTGCLATGDGDTFLLKKGVPFMSPREQRMAAGGDPTPPLPDAAKPKTYDLVPGKGIKLAEHVGHRVDVTGTIETSDPHGGHGGHDEAGSTGKEARTRVTVTWVQHLSPTCS